MKWKRKIYVTLFMLPLITASCGGGVDNLAPVSGAEDSRPGHSLEAAGGEQVLAEGTAAGDFYYMELDSRLTYGLYESYAINTEWLYVTDRVEPEDESDSDEPGCFSITRNNRQNRKYRIEFVDGGSNTFDYEKKLIQRDGADLMEIGGIYTGNLARHGAFENLEPYFESSAAVSMGDILESVREAGTIGGKNVAVITSFQINTLRARGDFVMPKEWTVWKFLEMGEEGQMFSYQSPQKALDLCMGLKYGEHFVDYEERTCSFDGEEFRRILEACGRWKVYDDGSNVSYSQKKGDWLFDEQYVHNIRDIVPPELPIPDSYEYEGEDYLSTLVGYPGWEGGEYEFRANIMLAINSVSENKEGAWDFLEYLLSEEIQAMMAQISGSLPVRKDCFEKCLRDGYADPANSMPVRITEKEFERMLEMAESAIMDNWGSHSNPLWDIVTEEAEMYFAGDSTLDSAVQKIQARVQLYLDEL